MHGMFKTMLSLLMFSPSELQTCVFPPQQICKTVPSVSRTLAKNHGQKPGQTSHQKSSQKAGHVLKTQLQKAHKNQWLIKPDRKHAIQAEGMQDHAMMRRGATRMRRGMVVQRRASGTPREAPCFQHSKLDLSKTFANGMLALISFLSNHRKFLGSQSKEDQ